MHLNEEIGHDFTNFALERMYRNHEVEERQEEKMVYQQTAAFLCDAGQVELWHKLDDTQSNYKGRICQDAYFKGFIDGIVLCSMRPATATLK